ncbi:MAG: zf-TFIIB domain-containing protein [Dehalococcoidia bacterium]|nr:zf-TFIIB domain-containing protein [Dehalococcoidia bacterium]
MICPACKKPMFVVEYRKIELDYCGNCHGVWFDAGELELLVNTAVGDESKKVLETMLAQKDAPAREKRRRCPLCLHKMKKVDISQNEHVLIDTCVYGDGLWFDGGEVDHLVKYLSEKAPPISSGVVFNFVKEVIKTAQ